MGVGMVIEDCTYGDNGGNGCIMLGLQLSRMMVFLFVSVCHCGQFYVPDFILSSLFGSLLNSILQTLTFAVKLYLMLYMRG